MLRDETLPSTRHRRVGGGGSAYGAHARCVLALADVARRNVAQHPTPTCWRRRFGLRRARSLRRALRPPPTVHPGSACHQELQTNSTLAVRISSSAASAPTAANSSSRFGVPSGAANQLDAGGAHLLQAGTDALVSAATWQASSCARTWSHSPSCGCSTSVSRHRCPGLRGDVASLILRENVVALTVLWLLNIGVCIARNGPRRGWRPRWFGGLAGEIRQRAAPVAPVLHCAEWAATWVAPSLVRGPRRGDSPARGTRGPGVVRSSVSDCVSAVIAAAHADRSSIDSVLTVASRCRAIERERLRLGSDRSCARRSVVDRQRADRSVTSVRPAAQSFSRSQIERHARPTGAYRLPG